MPITFDTLDELKAFYRTFRLDSNGNGNLATVAVEEEEESKPRRGRKPGSLSMIKSTGKRGPKAHTAKASLEAKPKRDKSNTLTAKIQGSINQFLNASQSFTANDVYDDLVKSNPDINKQSVITSVLKQMNSTFKDISVTERPGNGPRPVKLYNA